MADIGAVEVKIMDAEKQLNAATDKEDIVYWRKKEEQLRKEKEQLRKKELLLLGKGSATDTGKIHIYSRSCCCCSCSCFCSANMLLFHSSIQ